MWDIFRSSSFSVLSEELGVTKDFHTSIKTSVSASNEVLGAAL